jgi:tRNA threonylcarbamoyladenosine biosynthesis protein TsaE
MRRGQEKIDMAFPIKRQFVKDYFSRTEEETILLGTELSKNFMGDEVVLLSGGLGAGKTVFSKGIAAGLEVTDVHQVRSPSFNLINIYQAKYPLYHIDLYRLENKTEIEDLGWEEFLGEGVIIVEWAEKMDFRGEAILVALEKTGSSERKIHFSTDAAILAALFP